jgi:hypothetical protein
MKYVGAIIIVLLIMITNVNAQGPEDYWIACENSTGGANMLNKLEPGGMDKLEMTLVYDWAQLKENCITDCTWFKMWLVDETVCVEYQIRRGARI